MNTTPSTDTTPHTNTPHANTPHPTTCIGLDISKDTIDACLLTALDARHQKQFTEKQFANNPNGQARLLRWAQQLMSDSAGHFCLEATGPYSHTVALFLVEREQVVSVINPARLRFFGLAQGAGNKTDKADARLIALYCQQQKPSPWRVAAGEVRQLQALVRRLHALSELVVQEKNRLQAPGQDKAIVASGRRVIRSLEQEMLRLKAAIRTHVQAHANLQRDASLLQSIPGIGEITSWDILAEMPDVTSFASAQSVAAYAGLAPKEHKSGSSVRKPTHLSKQGNSRLRKALYFPAVTAIIHNPLVREHYQRMVQQGKPKMVALAAAMRKLLMICYGVLKHQQPFQASWQGPPQALLNCPLTT